MLIGVRTPSVVDGARLSVDVVSLVTVRVGELGSDCESPQLTRLLAAKSRNQNPNAESLEMCPEWEGSAAILFTILP